MHSRATIWPIAIGTGLLYIFIGYFINRSDTAQLLSAYFLLFGLYYLIIRSKSGDAIRFWIIAAIGFRVVLVFALPNLSDDFYRFIWDGRLWHAGIHPFSALPKEIISQSSQFSHANGQLYELLNSKEYFTVYPPLAQVIFWLSVIVSPHSIYGSVIGMKVLVVMAEVGTLYLLIQLLLYFKLPKHNVLLYALNPLVIIELTGNLHFEAFAIFFLLLAFFLLARNRFILSGASWAAAICCKLLPLLFLPTMLFYVGWKRSLRLYLLIALFCCLFFFPLFDGVFLQGFSESLGYYFKKFEFNASIYYLVREWGFWYYGYNIIQTVGWKLAAVSSVLILTVSLSIPYQQQIGELGEKNTLYIKVFSVWLSVLVIYILFSTTVHPWYIIPLIAFCVFTPYRFPVWWSATVFLTYAGYSQHGFQENYWLVAFEYVSVLALAVYELVKNRKNIHDATAPGSLVM